MEKQATGLASLFQVSLFTELAALKVLEALQLPPTSQITNAAGKFLIVAPNTAEARAQLAAVRTELNNWFLQHSFGLAGLGLAGKAASSNDFLDKKPAHRFQALMGELFADLEKAKLHRFDLTAASAPSVFDVQYPHGVCRYNDRLPADRLQDGQASAALSRDQIEIGKGLARQDRLLVLRQGEAVAPGGSVKRLEVPIFGYTVAFTADEDRSGKFGNLASNASLARCWDFSLPDTLDAPLWHGYARRYINAYVPRFGSLDLQTQAKYKGIEEEVDADAVAHGAGKTLTCQALQLQLYTPLRLQHQGHALPPARLTPRTLISAVARRTALALEFHAQQPHWGAQVPATIALADSLHDQRQLHWFDWTRYSSRQQQTMALGGVLGTWQLHGPADTLAQLWPWLWLGQWLHIGKNATMGLGGYRLMPD